MAALLESVTSSWRQNVKPVEKTEQTSFCELFGELNSKDNLLKQYQLCSTDSSSQMSTSKNDVGFCLQLCTEGLGSESSDDVEELQMVEEKVVSSCVKHVPSHRRSGMSREAFPPPLSFIGRNGKAGVFFKSYRQDGRFVLKQVTIPTQEFLQAHRQDGRLKLQIVQPNHYLLEEEDRGGDEDEDEHEQEDQAVDDVQELNYVSNVSNNGQS